MSAIRTILLAEDSPADAELWAPTHLTGPARADWLEGFRSHFEPRHQG